MMVRLFFIQTEAEVIPNKQLLSEQIPTPQPIPISERIAIFQPFTFTFVTQVVLRQGVLL